MTTGLDVLRWAITLFLAAFALGIAGLSVYHALYMFPREDAPWTSWVFYRLGQGLVAAGVLLVAGSVLGAGVAAGIAVFSR